MKKVLLGTTAIIAAGMIAAPAASAKVELSVGGFMEQWVGFSSQDDLKVSGESAEYAVNALTATDVQGLADEDPVKVTDGVKASTTDNSGSHMVSDSEIFFKGTSELDNGLMVSVEVQMEGNVGNIDESFMTISGAFGELRIGDEDGAMSTMHYGVRDSGIGLNSGDVPTWVVGNVEPELSGTSGWAADAPKVIYYSPRTGGVQFGISYAPGTAEDSNDKPDRNAASVKGKGGVTDSITTGLNYQGDMGGAMLGLSVGYRTGAANGDGDEDPNALNAGIRVTVGGFGIDAAYLTADDVDGMTYTSAGVGVSYSQGPMSISLGYQVDEDEGDANGEVEKAKDAVSAADAIEPITDLGFLGRPAVVAAGEADAVMGQIGHAKRETLMLSGSYTLGAGISLNGSLGTATLSSDNMKSVEEVEGTFAVVGVKVSF